MKNNVVTIALIAGMSAIVGCTSGKTINVSSRTAVHTVDVKGFSAVESHDILDVNIRVAPDYSARVTGPENLVDYVKLTVDGDLLSVRFVYPDRDADFGTETPRIAVDVQTPRLDAVSSNGMSKVEIRGAGGRTLDVAASDMSNLSIEGNSTFETLNVTADGQSTVHTGNISAVNAGLNASGQASINLAELTAANVMLSATGQSTISGLSITTTAGGTAAAIGQAAISFHSQKGPGQVETTITGQSDINLGR